MCPLPSGLQGVLLWTVSKEGLHVRTVSTIEDVFSPFSFYFSAHRLRFHDNPSEKEGLTCSNCPCCMHWQGSLHSSSCSARLVAACPTHRAYSLYCVKIKWRTARTATYTEIVTNTTRVGLNLVHRRRLDLNHHG